jgi:hypothetical protein
MVCDGPQHAASRDVLGSLLTQGAGTINIVE